MTFHVIRWGCTGEALLAITPRNTAWWRDAPAVDESKRPWRVADRAGYRMTVRRLVLGDTWLLPRPASLGDTWHARLVLGDTWHMHITSYFLSLLY